MTTMLAGMKLSRWVAVPLLVAPLALTGCAGSANAAACKLYEDAYNQLADAARMKGDGLVEASYVQAQLDMLPSRFQDAFDKATGDVAVAMRTSVESAAAANAVPDNADVGIGSMMDMTTVQEACAADGASIVFNDMKSQK